MLGKNENVFYDENLLTEIVDKFYCACIITCTNPSFTFPSTNTFYNSRWIGDDVETLKQIKEERNIMDKIYNKIIEKDKKPYVWFYGKYNFQTKSQINDILFISLNKNNLNSFSDIMSLDFSINTNKKIVPNNHDSMQQDNMMLKRNPNWYDKLECVEDDDARLVAINDIEQELYGHVVAENNIER